MKNDGEIYLEGKKYISSKRAAKLTGYTHDYVGQLFRTGKVKGSIIGKTRFVEEDSLLEYKKLNNGLKNIADTTNTSNDNWEDILFGKISGAFKSAGNHFKNKDILSTREDFEVSKERNIPIKTSNTFSVKKEGNTSKIRLSEERRDEILSTIKSKKKTSSSSEDSSKIKKDGSISKSTITPYKSLLPVMQTGEFLRRVAIFAFIFSIVSGGYFLSDSSYARTGYKIVAQTTNRIASSAHDSVLSAIGDVAFGAKEASKIFDEGKAKITEIKIPTIRIPEIKVPEFNIPELKIAKIENPFSGIKIKKYFIGPVQKLSTIQTSIFDSMQAGVASVRGFEKNIALSAEKITNSYILRPYNFYNLFLSELPIAYNNLFSGYVRTVDVYANSIARKELAYANIITSSVGSLKSAFGIRQSATSLLAQTGDIFSGTTRKLRNTIDEGGLYIYGVIESTKKETKDTVFGWFDFSGNDTDIVIEATQISPKQDGSSENKDTKGIVPTSSEVDKKPITIVEKIIETRVVEVAPSPIVVASVGVKEEDFERRLEELNNELRQEIYRIQGGNSSNTLQTVYQTIAHSNRIDRLDGVTITNATISGSTISSSGLNFLPLSGGTLSGAITGTSATFTGALTVSASTTFNGIEYLFPGADGTNGQALTTNAAGGLSWTTIVSSGGGVSDWQKETNFGGLTLTPTTTIPVWIKDSLYASSTLTVAGTASFASNVGIGTTSPYAKLSVVGETVSEYFTATSTTAISSIAGIFSVGSTTPDSSALFSVGTSSPLVFVDKNSGYVGVGTAAPNSALDVIGNIRAGSGSSYATLYQSSGTGVLDTSGGDLFLRTGGGNKLLIYSSGDSGFTGTLAVGESIAEAHFEVSASGTTGGAVFMASSNDTTDGDLMIIQESGFVGIGTTSPLAKLDTYGNIILSGLNRYINFDYTTGSTGYGLRDNAGTVEYKNSGGSWAGIGSGGGGASYDWQKETNFGGLTLTPTTTIPVWIKDSLYASSTLTVAGTASFASNVGIGTTSPYAKLSVVGETVSEYFTATSTTATSTFAGGFAAGTSGLVYDFSSGNVGIGTAAPDAALTVAGVIHQGSGTIDAINSNNFNADIVIDKTTPQLEFRDNTRDFWVQMVTGGSLQFKTESLKIPLYLDVAGNVGIGTTSPYAKLSVVGETVSEYFTATSTTATSTFAGGFTAGTSGLVYDYSSGNVGIGTAAPLSQLHLYENTGTADSGAGFTVEQDGSGDAIVQYLLTSAQRWVTGIDNSDGDKFKIASTADLNSDTKLTITTTGNVGIGNTAPATLLHLGTDSVTQGYIRLESDGSAGEGNIYANSTGGLTIDTASNAYNITLKGSNIILDPTSNVGIGTTSPYAKLSVTGFINTDQYSGYKQAGNTVLYASSTNFSILVGQDAAAVLSTSALNTTALGYQALKTQNTGSNNTAVGYQSLYSSNTSNANTAIGSASLRNTTWGEFNTAVGVDSLRYNTEGYYNTATGYQALYTKTTGSSNTAFGFQAGDNLSSGSNNTIIGGNSIDFPSATASNQLNIGNIIYGTNIDGTGTTLSTGNVGIGTTSPLTKLDTYGNIILSGLNRYINFDYTSGSTGYGLRDNAGTVEYKNSGGSWAGIGSGGGGASYDWQKETNFGALTLTPTTTIPVWIKDSLYASSTLNVQGLATFGNASTTQLSVSGPAYFDSTTKMNGVTYSWPGADGSNAQVLASDGAGGLSWSTVSQGTTISPSFSIRKNGVSQSIPNAAYTKVTWSTELFDTNSDFASDKFTPSVAGKYLLTTDIYWEDTGTASQWAQVVIYKNGTPLETSESKGNGSSKSVSITTVATANGTTDYFEIYVYQSSTVSQNIGGAGSQSHFSGSRIDGGGLWTDGGSTSYLATTDLVGVGTSTAYSALTVWGDGTGTGQAFEVVNNASTTLLAVLDNGNVGVGTTSPYAKLSVVGETVSEYFTATSTTAISSIAGIFSVGSTTPDSSALFSVGTSSPLVFVDKNSGYVGVGTAAPNSALDVIGNIRAGSGSSYATLYQSYGSGILDTSGGDLFLRTGGGNKLLLFSDGSSSFTGTLAVGESTAEAHFEVSASGTTGGAVFMASSNDTTDGDLMIIQESGFVGIGTTSPYAKLSVVGETVSEYFTATSTTATSYFAGKFGVGTSTPWGTFSVEQGDNDTSVFVVGDNGTSTPHIRVDGAGVTYISQLNTGAMAFEDDSGQISWINMGITSSAPAGTKESYSAQIDANSILTVYAESDGAGGIQNSAIGIGTTSPWAKLSVNGTAAFTGLTNDATGYYVCLNSSTYELATSTTACGASSIRFKENIKEITYGLEDILALNPVSFDWKESFLPNNKDKQIGFIAEEVADVIPELAGRDKDGVIMNLDYPKLTAVLAKAIQELNDKVDNLSASAVSGVDAVIDETVSTATISFGWIVDKFAQIGITISEGAISAQQFVADKIIAKKAVLDALEMTDSVTGEVYCLRISNGEWDKFKGTCGEVSVDIPVPPTPEPDPIPDPVLGCTDSEAENYNVTAEEDDGSCTYSEPDTEPEPDDIVTTTPEVITPDPVLGCTDGIAENYNADATEDDESCTYPEPEPILGCIDDTAENYDLTAEEDDGSCTYPEPESEPVVEEDTETSIETTG